MSLPELPPRAADGATMLSDLRHGWRYFNSRPWIWSVTLAFATFNAINMGVWSILGPVIATGTIGAAGWGLVVSIRGAGALLATMATAKLTVRRPMVPALTLMTLVGVPLILLGVHAGTVWLAAAAFTAGVAAAFFTVAWSTVWHTHVPERLSSRVGAWDEFGSFASIPLGQLSIPILATTFGTEPVAIIGGALTMIAMLLPLLLPSLRRIEIPAPSDHGK
jgi:MFS family permease